MDARVKELVREVLDEIWLIRARKAKMPRSLEEAKGDLKDASHIANRLYGFGHPQPKASVFLSATFLKRSPEE